MWLVEWEYNGILFQKGRRERIVQFLAKKIYGKYAKIYSDKKAPRQQWFKSIEIRRKYKIHCKLRASPNNEELPVQYRYQCSVVKKVVCGAIFSYESILISRCKSNPKLLYSYVKIQISCREKIRSLIDKNGNHLVERADIANCLNNQFCEVFNTKLLEELPTIGLRTAATCDIDLVIFSSDRILKMLINSNINKLAGTDGLNPKLLNRCAMSFASILSSIFTSSFTNSFVSFA